MAVRPIDKTWSKFVWNLGESELLARKFRDGKACLIDLRLAVEAQPTITPPNEWVSVEERRPQTENDVFALLACGDCAVVWYTGSVWRVRWDGSRLDREPTHWMPLPEPPDRRPPEGEEDA